MKKLISLLLTVFFTFSFVSAFAEPFSDIDGHWAGSEILKAYESKTINGDTDGRFRPDDDISRAEFMKMVTVLLAEKLGAEIPENEASKHWADKYYSFAVSAYLPTNRDASYDGICPGVMSLEDLDIPVRRWEMAYILSSAFENVFGLYEEGELETEISDLETVESYDETVSGAIKSIISLKLANGDQNGCFNPQSTGTRAEAVVLINRAADLIDDIIEYYTKLQEQQEELYKNMEEALEESNVAYTKIPSGHPVVEFTMSDGRKFEVTLYPEYAPQTCANFLSLVRSKFYDGLTFHRIVENFMAQGGDPNGDGTGGAEGTIFGEFSDNGFEQNTLSHERGVVSMARSSLPNSASSQFFICYADASFLDGQYAAFGKVTKGMDVVDDFLKVERALNEMGEEASPVTPIKIGKAIVKKNK